MSTEIAWTHPSVRALLQEVGDGGDPVDAIAARARDVALQAIDEGWTGPPFDPFELAARLSVEIVPRESLEDARLVADGSGKPRIEFNPVRRPARARFSVAHEIGHLLFTDHGDRARYRNQGHLGDREDAWQLEMLCNVAAAELLMPAGAFPLSEADDIRLTHLLDLRATFGVSTEALLRRVMRLTGQEACMFACARRGDGRFRLDYTVGSRAWDGQLRHGQLLPAESAMSHCTAVGFSVDDMEHWPGTDEAMRLQAIGVPSYPGDQFPRVIGLLSHEGAERRRVEGVRMVRGDATTPHRDGPVIIAHIVNNAARRWGGQGFSRALGSALPAADTAYAEWAADAGRRRLGSVHIYEAEEGLWVASMVAQAGYGETASGRSRLRLPALVACLRELESLAQEREASVHMPPIGTGQGAMPWPTVRDLVLELVVDAGVPVTVYVLEGQPMPAEQAPLPRQLSLA